MLGNLFDLPAPEPSAVPGTESLPGIYEMIVSSPLAAPEFFPIGVPGSLETPSETPVAPEQTTLEGLPETKGPLASSDPFDDFEDDDFDDEFDDDFEEEWDDDDDDDGFGPEFQDDKEDEFDVNADVPKKKGKGKKGDAFSDDDDFDD